MYSVCDQESCQELVRHQPHISSITSSSSVGSVRQYKTSKFLIFAFKVQKPIMKTAFGNEETAGTKRTRSGENTKVRTYSIKRTFPFFGSLSVILCPKE